MSLIRLLNNRVFTRAKRRKEKVRSGKREFLTKRRLLCPRLAEKTLVRGGERTF